MPMLRRTIAILALGAYASACASSSYLPQTPGHVAIVMLDGKLAYTRDGNVYPAGIGGGGLEAAVAGNPAAEHAARTYHSRVSTGIALAIVGAVVEGVAAAAIPYAIYSQNSNAGPVAVGAFVGGLVLALTGASIAASGESYRWDAINMFNDGAGMRPQAVPYAPPPYVAPAYGPQQPPPPPPVIAPPGAAP
jgi:hypothetical protein